MLFVEHDGMILSYFESVPSSVKADSSQVSNAHKISSRVTCLVKFEIDDTINCRFELLVRPHTRWRKSRLAV